MDKNKKPLTRSQIRKQRQRQRQKERQASAYTVLTIIYMIVNTVYIILKLLGLTH